MPDNLLISVEHTLEPLKRIVIAPTGPETESDFFCSPAWFHLLHESGFDSSAEIRLYVVSEQNTGNNLAIPMYTNGEAGAGLAAFSNYYGSMFAPVGDGAFMTGRWQTLARFWRDQRPRWPFIRLAPLAAPSTFYDNLQLALRDTGYWVDNYFCFGNWYLELAGRDFAEYYAGLPSILRNTVKRARKRLDKTGPWRIEIHDRPGTTTERGIEHFQQVYARSWKQPEPFPEFIPTLCRTAAEHGWLRLGVLTMDATPVAAQIWIVKDGRALIYKLAYDEQFRALSAGSVLSATLFEHAIDVDRAIEIDYLTGDDAYKRDWMSHRRERRGIVAFDPLTLRGLVGGINHFGRSAIKRLFEKSSTANAK